MMSLELLLAKLEGNLTQQQESDFQHWLQESNENLQFYQKLELLKKEGKSYHLYKKIDTEVAWEELLRKKTHDSFTPTPSKPYPTILSQHRASLIAAMVALLIGSVALVYYLQVFSGEVLKETSFGEKMTFVLPDQSEVTLNANSRLRYRKNNPRKIWLEGEAFFEVSKKPETQEKFWVHTPDLTIEVLGTAFNVNSHQEKTKVSLEEGAIKLDLYSESIPDIVLVPGEILTYSRKKSTVYEKKRIETHLESSWKAGIQLFEKTPLTEILDKMEEIYGVKIHLKNDKLPTRLITMGIPIEDFEIALATIENVLGIKIIEVDKLNYYFE